jgi:hypothetical protein
MFRRRLSRLRLHVRGRVGSWLALVGQFIAVVGLPLPAVAKDRSIPFPCQSRACGCQRASDCWRSCCCFSAATRVAWAQDHGVEPPESLVEEAQTEAPAETGAVCCHTEKKRDPGTKKNAAPSLPWLIMMQASRCNGQPDGEAKGPPIAPPSPHVVWDFEWAPLGVLATSDVMPSAQKALPLVPPPRSH